MGKAKQEEKRFPIVTIDNYNHRYYRYENGRLATLDRLSYRKNVLNTAFIANKDMIVAPIELSSGISEEDVPGALEDKAYEELSLDPAVEYLIRYKEVESEGNGRIFHLFVLERKRYDELFGDLRNKVKYVDYIVPAPLLYKALYDEELVESKKIHCYLYFSSYDTTLTFYKNGEFLYSKSINYSLDQLYDRYCEIAGKTVDEKEFLRIFQKEGVKTTHLEYQKNLIKLFNEIFITINDVIIYTKRAYQIDMIDQLFIGSELGPISGVDEYAQNYLGLYSSPLIFDYGIESSEWYVDQMHYLMVRSTEHYVQEREEPVNFTLYPRPPAFYKRPSGQFTFALIAALLIASALPLYYLGSAYLNKLHIYKLQKDEEPLGKEVQKYKQILSEKKKEIKKLDEEIARLKKIYDGKAKTLTAVYRKKVDYRLKSNQVAAFAEDLAKYGVKVNAIRTQNDTYNLALISPEDQNITSLIKYISDKYSDEIGFIDIHKIRTDENSSVYRGILKVKMR